MAKAKAKTCPFCAEEIHEKAVKCKHCGEFLDRTSRRGLAKDFSVNDALTGVQAPAPPLLSNRYEIDRELGRGGMAVVYLARDRERAGAEVAIKVLPEQLAADEKAVKDFAREADLAMSLSHPNILRLHNLENDTDTGVRYLVMEYVKEESLAKVIAEQGTLPVDEAVDCVKQALGGLEYAHGKKVVHRDLKPSNLMRDSDGTVKIADFGIARRMKDTLTRLTGRAATGTLLYMSPEQLRGEPMDVRSDVYSMGCVLYELLSGRPPFHTGSVEWQIMNQEPKPIDGVPGDVMDAMVRAMAKASDDRFASAGEFAAALAGETVEKKKKKRKKAGAGETEICPGCRAEVPLDSMTCPDCGALMPATPDRFVKAVTGKGLKKNKDEGVDIVCPKCSSPVSADDEFCVECGHKLEVVSRKRKGGPKKC
ncbi:MAG: protein kinase domain-containing protein, partial [Planctomycetota bacterium]